ncbi:MAG TPA: hypothetical protein DCY07_06195 [Rhodospirillaceae bacterium]|nr:hypothetical protein [Rhodospirillaceae bacterium]
MMEINKLSLATEKTHQHEITHILQNLSREEKQSAFLIILVLIGSFALIVALLDAVYRYKSNAERARAAEKCNAIFAAALQSTRVGVLIRDMRKPDRPAVFVNSAFTRITGYVFDDVRSDSTEFLFGWNTDPLSIAAFRRAVSLQETATFELQLYRKNGTPFWSEWNLSPVLDEEGRLAYFVSLFTDNTAIRQTQDDLIQAKALAEQACAVKTSFLAMMSHEIRTPINGMLGVLKLLHETKLDDEQRHLLSIAKTSSSALHGIINDILDYVKMEAGKIEIFPEAFSLNELLTELTQFARSLLGEKSIEIVLQQPENIPDRLFGDVGRLRQILLNLLSNAIKFTDEGRIVLRVISMMPQEVSGQPGHLVRFEVQDTGIGINKDDQDKLFQEFSQIERSFTRRFGGTGLGLAICRRLVTMMHGEIGVESQLGKGSKFWFLLPLQEGEAAPQDFAATAARPADNVTLPRRACTVLLVEDNDTNRLVSGRYLEKAGVLVEEACNGVQAIEKVKHKNYDLILMDISMPEMDGMLATCHIRALGGHNAKVPIIALTAHVMAGDRELCLAAGMNDYLNKPLEQTVLIKTLERWLHIKLTNTEPVNNEPVSSVAAQPDDKEIMIAASSPPQFGCEEDALVFDARILQRMKDDLGGAVVDQVTKTFLADSARRIDGFKNARNNEVRDTAHTMKSSSANCGLMRFSRLMADLEAAAEKADTAKMQGLLPLVADIYAISKARLEKERENFIT